MKRILGKQYSRKITLKALAENERHEGQIVCIAGLKHYIVVHIGSTMAYLKRLDDHE